MFGMSERLNLTPAQQQAWDQAMLQTHQQMAQLHQQARAKVLGSLTPAHRTLVAQVVGSLAIAPNPDWQAAAKQLDAALSPAESQAVLSAHAGLMQQAQSLMEGTHQKLMSLLTAQQRAQLPFGGAEPPHPGMPELKGMPGMMNPTAGEILLHLGSGDPGPMMMTIMHHP